MVFNTKDAFDTVMQYLSEQGEQVVPAISAGWQEEDITPEGIIGSRTVRYWHEEWTITVKYPITFPQVTVYQVVVLGGPYTGWYWKGSVNHYGDIAEYQSFGQLTVDTSREIAREFIVNSPTFRFDGLIDTLVLTETITLRCPYCWQFVFEFDSSHSGYGDRAGQVLLKVITHHRVVVTVDNGQVSYAVMDGRWHMIEQELIPPI